MGLYVWHTGCSGQAGIAHKSHLSLPSLRHFNGKINPTLLAPFILHAKVNRPMELADLPPHSGHGGYGMLGGGVCDTYRSSVTILQHLILRPAHVWVNKPNAAVSVTITSFHSLINSSWPCQFCRQQEQLTFPGKVNAMLQWFPLESSHHIIYPLFSMCEQ